MGFIDEFKKWAKIDTDDEDEEFDEFVPSRRRDERSDNYEDIIESKRSNKVVNIRIRHAASGRAGETRTL